MISLHCLCNNFKPIPLWLEHPVFRKTSKTQSFCLVRAVDKDSQQFEIDPDEAKVALQNLDQQLQLLSQKQITPSKIKASDVKLTRGRDETTEEELEFSGSGLTYAAIALFLFTIFYNTLFYTVIKPSFDTPLEPSPASTTTDVIRESSEEAAVLQLLPLVPDVFSNTKA